MAKLYNVHVGFRYTTDILVEAGTPEEAQNIVEKNIDCIELSDMVFTSDDYDTFEEDINDYSQYYIMTENGTMEKRVNYNAEIFQQAYKH